MLKNTVGPTFPTMVQEPENTFDDINSQEEYLKEYSIRNI